MIQFVDYDIKKIFLLREVLVDYTTKKDKSSKYDLLGLINDIDSSLKSLNNLEKNWYKRIDAMWMDLEIIYAMHEHDRNHAFLSKIFNVSEDLNKKEQKEILKIISSMQNKLDELIDEYYSRLKKSNLNDPAIFGKLLRDMVLKGYTPAKIADIAVDVLKIYGRDLDFKFKETLDILDVMNYESPNFELSYQELNQIADDLIVGKKEV
jgi:hypothetical protein